MTMYVAVVMIRIYPCFFLLQKVSVSVLVVADTEKGGFVAAVDAAAAAAAAGE